ncbi:hypothetical protein MIR68_008585 [Amoeboaphelidium protococcarum]|nr:hypothetical protein MIR68_008585 [Amoeboaphelidium protococcarum]
MTSNNYQMERKKSGAHIKQADLDSIHKRLYNQLKSNAETQQELIKALSLYRLTLEHLASASDKVARTAGKLALGTATSFDLQKELDNVSIHSSAVNEENELKQRNLSAALQQVVKFHTVMSAQQANVANSLINDFEHPVQLNLQRYRDTIVQWDRHSDREIKRVQNDIKQKEAEATRAGRHNSNKDMSKLSETLFGLTEKLSELSDIKIKVINSGLATNQNQYFFVAHHLQKVLRAEVQSFRSIYHDGTAVPKNTYTPLRKDSKGSIQSSLSQPKSESNSVSQSIQSTPLSISTERKPVRPMKSPLIADIKSSFILDNSGNIIPSAQESQNGGEPVVPQNPHRKTMAFPKNAAPNLVNQIIKNNFASISNVQSPISRAPRRKSSGSFEDELEHFRKETEFISTYNSPTYLSGQDAFLDRNSGDGDVFAMADKLMKVVHDYEGDGADDLKVVRGDMVRVVAVEGEWLYGWLMSYEDGEQVPVEHDGVPQIGWIPLNFVEEY